MFSEKKIVTIGNDDFNYDAKKVFLGSAQSYNHSLASTALSSGFKSTTQNFYSQNLSTQNFTPQNFTTQNFTSQNLTSENRTRSMSNSHVRSLSNSNVRSVSNSHVRSPSYSKVQSPSYSNIQSPMLSTYDSGKQSYLMRESFVSKKDPITQFAKFKEDSWANYSRAYPYYFGRLPDYQLPSYYDYYPYNHHLPSTRFYRLFDDYENAYHCVPYVPPYTYYKAYRDLVHEPYYSSFLYYRSRDYYGPYVYHSPYTGNLYPLRYSRYHYPELLARPTYFYRHELLKEDLHPYSKDYFIPYYRPRFYYRVYPRQPSYYYLSSTGKRFYLGDDYINYYAKPVLEYRNEKPKKNYFDDNMFNYDIKPSTRKYYPTRYQYNNKVKVPYPNTKLYNSDAIRWKYSTLSYKK